MSADAAAIAAYETGFARLRYAKYYIMASCIVNLYDHLITLDLEIEHIWRSKTKWRLPTYCFFAFRYFPPVISIVNFFADHDPRFRGSICQNWIWLPVFNAPLVSMSTGVIMSELESQSASLRKFKWRTIATVLRVYVIYNKAWWILAIVIPLYLAEIGVMLWAVPAGSPAVLPPGWIGCIPAKKPGTGDRLTAMFIAALIFDAVLFILTISRGIFFRRARMKIGIVKLIIRDGALYFFVIFLVNMVNVLLLMLAPEELSAINTPLASLIAATMVARMVFNLRSTARRQMNLSTLSAVSTTSTRRYETIAFLQQNSASTDGTTSTFLGLDEFEVRLEDIVEVPEPILEAPEEAIELRNLNTPPGM